MWRSWTSIRLSMSFPEEDFLDGADYFDTFRNLVYTNIASPEYGAKITGKMVLTRSDFWQPTMKTPALSCRGPQLKNCNARR